MAPRSGRGGGDAGETELVHEYLRRHGAPAHPSEIARHAVFSYTLLAMGEQWAFEGPEGPVSVKVAPGMRSNSGEGDGARQGPSVTRVADLVDDESVCRLDHMAGP